MPSWQSYLIDPILRLRVKRVLARAETTIAARRAFNARLPAPGGVRFTTEILGGIEGEWARTGQPPTAPLLYLHGGGYFACSPQTHRPITGGYARRGFEVFAPDYRLAPEHPFPAAVDDALAVYRAFAAHHPTGAFAIGGDSAGGGLTLATLLAAKAQNLPMPACAVLFSPWTDLAGTGASVTTNAARDCLLYAPRLAQGAATYLAGADAQNPLASPLYGDLAGLPPLLIQVAAGEILLDDSTRLAARARAAGVTVELSIWQNLPHVWQINQLMLPEARQAMDAAAAFARAALASQPVPA